MTPDEKTAQSVRESAQKAANLADQATEKISEFGERAQNRVSDVGRQLQSKLDRSGFNEETIPDAFRGMPKFISPRVHSFLDLAVTAYFAALGFVFASQRKTGPAVAAFINAGMVGGVSAMTNYEGTGDKPINFKLHGTLDAVQAATAAVAPVLFGFADETEARYFWGQAANEVTVISSTDWDAGMPPATLRKVA
jgi:hypothetical protein